MPYATPERAAEGRRYFIWGATAAILRNLYQFLRADRKQLNQNLRRRRAAPASLNTHGLVVARHHVVA